MGEVATERRRSERLRLRARAWCEAGGLTLYGRIGNLSASGLFLLGAAPLAPGTGVRVSIPLPDGDRELEVEAEVVWSRDPAEAERADEPATDRGASGLALRFVALSPAAQELLRTLLSQAGRVA